LEGGFGQISKKYVNLGGMALSDWTRCIRDIREPPVVDHSAPCGKLTLWVPFLTLIAVSLFLLILLVFNFQ
jgi:hypothetical protein